MSVVAPLLYFAVLPAIIALILAIVLANLLPEYSLRRRSLIAAVGAGFLPALLPILALMFANTGEYGGVAVAVLVGLALITTLVIGLPVALFAGRGKEVAGSQAKPFE